MSPYKKKKINQGLIVLNKRERTAVISLLSLICLLLGFSLFRPAIRFTPTDQMAFHSLDSMLAAYALEAKEASVTASPIPFDPPPTDHRTHARSSPYETAGANQSSVGERTTAKTSSTPSKPASSVNSYHKPALASLELNTADSTELIALPQIGEVMASRIHRYRDRLGGYVALDQLFEVKGMDTARFETVQPYLQLDANDIRHLNVNQDDFKTLLRHPYLEYEQVKAIVNHRERKGLIKNWEQLKELIGDVNPRLQSYTTY